MSNPSSSCFRLTLIITATMLVGFSVGTAKFKPALTKTKLSVKIGKYPAFLPVRTDGNVMLGQMKAMPLQSKPVLTLKIKEMQEFCRRGLATAPLHDGA